jgi:DNA-directed RNA polymerase specialized sigma24 family protein
MYRFQSCPETRAAALDVLYRRHGEDLKRQLRGISKVFGLPNEPEHVDERVQEVYCRLLTKGAQTLYQLRRWQDTRVNNYLGRIAQRVVLDELRAKRAAKRGGGGGATSGGRLLDLANRAVDPQDSPEEQAMLRQARRLLLERCRCFVRSQSLIRAEERERNFRVLRRSLLEGWSSEEIVRAEGGRMAASSVDTLVYRLRRRLERSGVELPSR